MTFDGKAFGQEIVSATKAHIEKTVGPLSVRIETIEKAIAEIDKVARAEVRLELADQKLKAADGLAEARKRKKAELAELVKQMVTEAVMALPPAENGKDADPELVASLVKSEAERILAGWERPQDGKSVAVEELATLIEDRVQRAVSAIPVPKDGEPGRNGFDAVEFLRNNEGHLIVTMSNGTTRDLGKIVGEDGKDADPVHVERVIAEKTARIAPPEIERDAYLAAFAPDDVAANVSLAIKMMAQMPETVLTQQQRESHPVNLSITMPEMKTPDTTVNVSLPEQPAPNVTVEPSVVNVAPANVHVETRRGKEVTKVTGWDKNGRVTSFEKTEVD